MSGERCGEEFAHHPTWPELVAICTRPKGHAGAHNNVLPKGGQLDPGPIEARPPLRVVKP